MSSLQRSVLVTGCAGRIGQALAETFGKAGYSVIGLDRTPTDMEHIDQFVQADLKRYVQEENYRADIDQKLTVLLDGLQVLINNAAVQKLGRFPNLKWIDWTETMDVNLNACMLLSKLCFPFLEESGGSIINIGSIHQELTKANFLAYSTSKSALIGFTKALSIDIGDRVRVNAISPAAIDTPMLRAGFNNEESKIDALRNLHPSGDIGSPFEVARTALFLSGPENPFLNGANITLDGGIRNVLNDL